MASRRAGATGAAACAHNGGGDDDIDDEACLLALAQAERDAENGRAERRQAHVTGNRDPMATAVIEIVDDEAPVTPGQWACSRCTFENRGDAAKCAMCESSKRSRAASPQTEEDAGANGKRVAHATGSASAPAHSPAISRRLMPGEAEALASRTYKEWELHRSRSFDEDSVEDHHWRVVESQWMRMGGGAGGIQLQRAWYVCNPRLRELFDAKAAAYDRTYGGSRGHTQLLAFHGTPPSKINSVRNGVRVCVGCCL